MSFTDEEIARIAHDANRALQIVLADPTIPVSPPWDNASEEDRRASVSGVKAGRYGATPEALHEKWMAEKQAAGWAYGETKDAEAKTHPLLVPFDQLPAGDRAKDYLFAGICSAMNSASDIKARVENEQAAIAESVARIAAEGRGNAVFGGVEPRTLEIPQPPAQAPERG